MSLKKLPLLEFVQIHVIEGGFLDVLDLFGQLEGSPWFLIAVVVARKIERLFLREHGVRI